MSVRACVLGHVGHCGARLTRLIRFSGFLERDDKNLFFSRRIRTTLIGRCTIAQIVTFCRSVLLCCVCVWEQQLSSIWVSRVAVERVVASANLFFKSERCLQFSLSICLSRTRTHTHTHTSSKESSKSHLDQKSSLKISSSVLWVGRGLEKGTGLTF